MPSRSGKPKRPRDPMQLAKAIGDIATGQTKDMPSAPVSITRSVGAAKGGKARAEKLTGEQRAEIARKAAAARWSRTRDESPPGGDANLVDDL